MVRNALVVLSDVHLEINHTLCFNEGQERQAIVQSRADIKLAKWCEGNKKHVGPQYLQCSFFLQYFTWSHDRKVWTHTESISVEKAYSDTKSSLLINTRSIFSKQGLIWSVYYIR